MLCDCFHGLALIGVVVDGAAGCGGGAVRGREAFWGVQAIGGGEGR